MIRIDVTATDGREWTFRTNNNGNYLFVGVGENRQISCESGFGDNRRTRNAIRKHLAYCYYNMCDTKELPRLKYQIV